MDRAFFGISVYFAACAFALVANANGKGNPSFFLNGTVRGIETGTLAISFGDEELEVPITNGRFSVTGRVDRPTLAHLWYPPTSNAAFFYLENNQIELSLEARQANAEGSEAANHIRITSVQGSKTEGIWQEYQAFYQRHKSTEGFQASLFRYMSNEVEKSPDNPFWGAAIAEMAAIERVLPARDVAALARKLDIERMAPQDVELLNMGLKSLAKYEIGKTLSGFQLPSPDGEELGPKNFRGKHLLVDFWASWCGSCRVKHREWKKSYEPEGDFEILSISIDENRAAWLGAVDSDDLPWENAIDENSKISSELGIVGVPCNFLLDPNGKILAMNVTIDEVNSLLERDVNPN